MIGNLELAQFHIGYLHISSFSTDIDTVYPMSCLTAKGSRIVTTPVYVTSPSTTADTVMLPMFPRLDNYTNDVQMISYHQTSLLHVMGVLSGLQFTYKTRTWGLALEWHSIMYHLWQLKTLTSQLLQLDYGDFWGTWERKVILYGSIRRFLNQIYFYLKLC